MERLIAAIRSRDVIKFSNIIKEEHIDFTEGSHSILHYAISSKRSSLFLKSLIERIPKEQLSYLLDLENKHRVTPLSLACNIGAWECAHLLIDCGANVNTLSKREGKFSSPLSCVLNFFLNKPKRMVREYITNYPVGSGLNIIEKMLQLGADPNVNFLYSNYFCPTPFWFAVLSDEEWIVKLFIHYSGKVSTKREVFVLGCHNVLEHAMYSKVSDTILDLLIRNCDDVKDLIDFECVVKALWYGTNRMIDVTLAFYTKYYSGVGEEQARSIMEVILSPYRRNTDTLLKILLLFPCVKDVCIVTEREIYWELDAFAKKCCNYEAAEILRNFDCKLFDLLDLHLQYMEITATIKN